MEQMQKNRIYESMTRIEIFEHGYEYTKLALVVRVWCRESERGDDGPRLDVLQAVKGLMLPHDIANALDQFPDVSAYEILDANGNGAIVYPDWP